MSKLPILQFEPQYKNVLWGGERIARFKGLPSQGRHVGESWELSAVPGHESIVSAGPLKGMNLREVLEAHGDEILGTGLRERFKNDFPLLVKLIDSADDLSIQVHPDHELARKRHNCMGKTEMWVSIAPEEGSFIYAGLKHPLTEEEYRRRIADNTIIESLGKYYTRKGDVFFLPAGQIHSIGKGNFVVEIQETSDITYRIYDFDRRDSEGNPRELHIEESIDAVDLNNTAGVQTTHIPEGKNKAFVLADCKHFTTEYIDISEDFYLDLKDRDTFTILISAEGNATLHDIDGNTCALNRGWTALVPAWMPGVRIEGACKLIMAYIK